MQAIDVGTEHFTTGLVEQELHEAITLKLSKSLGVGLK